MKGKEIMDFLNKLAGYKTYLVAIITAVLGAIQFTYPEFQVPQWAQLILAALGVAALRAGITAENTK